MRLILILTAGLSIISVLSIPELRSEIRIQNTKAWSRIHGHLQRPLETPAPTAPSDTSKPMVRPSLEEGIKGPPGLPRELTGVIREDQGLETEA